MYTLIPCEEISTLIILINFIQVENEWNLLSEYNILYRNDNYDIAGRSPIETHLSHESIALEQSKYSNTQNMTLFYGD